MTKIYEVRAKVELRFEVEAEEGESDDKAWEKAERLLDEAGCDGEVLDVDAYSYYGPFEARVPAKDGSKRWRIIRLVSEGREQADVEAAEKAAKLPVDEWNAAGVTVEPYRILV